MDLTNEHIGKTLLRFSLPIVLAFLLQSLYGIADLFVVGIAIGLAFPVSTLITVAVYLLAFAKGIWKESSIVLE